VEHRRTATATGLYDSFCHIFSFYTISHYIYLHLKKSLNDDEWKIGVTTLPGQAKNVCDIKAEA